MRYLALATDYDGTLAKDGQVDEPTLAALERFRDSGRRLILVTGRELDELLEIFPQSTSSSAWSPRTAPCCTAPTGREQKVLGEPPPPELVEAIRKKGVSPLSVGNAIIATVEPHQVAVLEAIRELGLEWQVIFNKGSVMVLPPGVNKATRPVRRARGAGSLAAQRRRRGGCRERPCLPEPVRVLGGGGECVADAQGAGRFRDRRSPRGRRRRADRPRARRRPQGSLAAA